MTPNDRGFDRFSTRDGVPNFRAARRHTLIELIRFAAKLRSEGVTVPPSDTLAAARALSVVGLDDRTRVADALRATLLSDPTDADAFESSFPTFWHRLRSGLSAVATEHDTPMSSDGDERETPPAADDDAGEPGILEDAEAPDLAGLDGDGGPVDVRIPTDRRHATGDRPESTGERDARRYSAVGRSERVDVDTARLTDAELAAIDRFVDALSTVPGRRRRRSPTGDRVEARRALRASLATGGAPIELPSSRPVRSELRCCLLIDVSGSVLDSIDRSVLLAFADRLHASARDAGVFLFDTDLVDVTRQFERGGDPAGALRDAAVEWGGGTKIGEAFATLRRSHPYAVDRRTVVVVVSDGLDVGDPDTLADGVTWLADRASAVVWLNPLAISSAFEPTSRGMSTATPYLDALFGFAEPADLDEAARQIEQRGLGGVVGYEHDARRFEHDARRGEQDTRRSEGDRPRFEAVADGESR
ncbi:VWA domain-containing protein [Halobellus captivus]|uniref:VWA domain-containing protein n=1 Tax=Halobellus captivus TaxID=2592614 RepID=UPI00119F8E4D|nr:VWA domain-containing protein [Halobellus captivus]